MSAWILKRSTVTLKHLQIFCRNMVKKLQYKREASCVYMHFRNGLIVVTRTLLLA